MHKTTTALSLAVALVALAPNTAHAQCYQGCSAILGFFGGLITGTALAQRPLAVMPAQPVYVQPNFGMATSNGCLQQLVGYDQFNRPIMQFVCR